MQFYYDVPLGVFYFILFIVIHEFGLVAFITSKKMLVITSSILPLFLPHYFSPPFLELQLNICLPLFLSPCILTSLIVPFFSTMMHSEKFPFPYFLVY